MLSARPESTEDRMIEVPRCAEVKLEPQVYSISFHPPLITLRGPIYTRPYTFHGPLWDLYLP